MPSRYVREITPEDVARVQGALRKEDREELIAMTGASVARAVRDTLFYSVRSWAATRPDTGEAFAIFGVGAMSSISDVGVPWLLATDEVREYCVPFAKHCREYVGEMHKGFEELENYVDGRNKLSMAWLKWCGFTIDPDVVDVRGVEFHRFHMRRGICV